MRTLRHLTAISYLSLIAVGAFGQAGELDDNFDADGKATVLFSTGDVSGYATLIAPDGDIYVAGTLTSPVFPGAPEERQIALARLNADGSLDMGYDDDGKVLGNFSGYNYSEVRGMARQSDGKIVVVGNAASSGVGSIGIQRFGIARFNTDGTPDTDFSTDGSTTVQFNTDAECRAWDVAIQNDGKIVVAGWTNVNDDPESELNFAVARLNANGSLDNSFSSNGMVQVDFGSYDSYAHSIALQNDDKIVLAGTYDYHNTNNQLASFMVVARLTPTGLLDSSFDGTGQYQYGTSTSTSDNAWDLSIQDDGHITVVGERRNADGSGYMQPLLIRVTSTGGTGVGTTQFNTPQGQGGGLRAVWQQCDGKLMASGYSVDQDNDEDFLVARIYSWGGLDNTFSGDGMTTAPFGYGNDVARGIAVRSSDQYITIAGSATLEDDVVGFGIARYQVETGIVPPAPTITFNEDECELTATGSGTFNWQNELIPFPPLWTSYATGNPVTVSEPDDYRVRVTAPNGCVSPWSATFTLEEPCIIDAIHEATVPVYHVSAYPNPVQDNVTVSYTLAAGTELGIHLQDVLGRQVATLLSPTHMAAGEQRRSLQLPPSLAHGNYLLVFSTPEGRSTVRVTK